MTDQPTVFVEVIDPGQLPPDDAEFDPCEEESDEPQPVGIAAFGATSHHVLATWLPAAFKKWGVKYALVSGWENRGRPMSSGRFDPNGILIHHTGSTSSASNPAPSLRTVIEGRSDLRGPLCQISTDFNGLTYIVAAGRANHAGKARAAMGNPAGDGNAMYLGNEVQTNGTQKMPKVQYDAIVRSTAAILDHFGFKVATKAGLHATTSLSGKWDLGAGTGKAGVPYDVNQLRRDVNALLKAGPPQPSKPTPTPPLTKEIIVFALVRATAVGPEVYKTDGFRRQHIGKKQLAALQKTGLKVTELSNKAELDAYGPVEPNPAGQV